MENLEKGGEGIQSNLNKNWAKIKPLSPIKNNTKDLDLVLRNTTGT